MAKYWAAFGWGPAAPFFFGFCAGFRLRPLHLPVPSVLNMLPAAGTDFYSQFWDLLSTSELKHMFLETFIMYTRQEHPLTTLYVFSYIFGRFGSQLAPIWAQLGFSRHPKCGFPFILLPFRVEFISKMHFGHQKGPNWEPIRTPLEGKFQQMIGFVLLWSCFLVRCDFEAVFRATCGPQM